MTKKTPNSPNPPKSRNVQKRPKTEAIPQRRGHSAGLLKSSLVAGSIVATIWGTSLIARVDATAANADAALSTIPAISAAPMQLTRLSGTAITLSPVTVDPIPTVHAPTMTGVMTGVMTGSLPGSTSESVIGGNTRSALVLDPIPQVAVPHLIGGLDSLGTPNVTELLSIELPAIPQIEIPAPVTQSRSSR